MFVRLDLRLDGCIERNERLRSRASQPSGSLSGLLSVPQERKEAVS